MDMWLEDQKALKEKFLSAGAAADKVLDYVSRTRARLHHVRTLAKEMLYSTQKRMKSFEVLVLLPVPGSSLSAHCAGSFCVPKVLSDTDYVI